MRWRLLAVVAVSAASAPSRAALLAIVSPAPGDVVGDSVYVSAAPDPSAEYEIVGVTASVGGATVPLEYGGFSLTWCCGCDPQGGWAATLPLSGLPHGRVRLTITAAFAGGAGETMTVDVVHDRPPEIVWSAPVPLAVGNPAFAVHATCTDDTPRGCAALEVARCEECDGGSPWPVVFAKGTSVVDGVMVVPDPEGGPSLPDGGALTLGAVARDGRGQQVLVTRQVTMVESTALQALETVSGMILDADTERVLFRTGAADAAGPAPLAILVRATGVIVPVEGPTATSGALTPGGAISKDGLGLRVRGSWAAWMDSSHVWRQDLVTGATVLVSDQPQGGMGCDVAEDGTVAFGAVGGEVAWFKGGQTTAVGAGHWPRTDGERVVASLDDGIVLWQGGEETLLASGLYQPKPPASYDVLEGWVAFVRPGPTGVSQVWTRSPDGVEEQRTFFAKSSRLEALGPEGALTVVTGEQWPAKGGTRYRSLPGSAAVNVGPAVGTALFSEGWLLPVGGALYALPEAKTPPPDPPPDECATETPWTCAGPLGPNLVPIDAVPEGELLAADDGRLLVHVCDPVCRVEVYDRNTGALQLVWSDVAVTGEVAEQGELTPEGALVATYRWFDAVNDCGYAPKMVHALYQWPGGPLAWSDYEPDSLQVKGAWAAWSDGVGLHRLDVGGGEPELVAQVTGGVGHSLAGDGTLAWWTADLSVWTSSLAAALSPAGALAVEPLLDGARTIYREGDDLHVIDPSGEATLEGAAIGGPGWGYQAAGGWIAFLKVDAEGFTQVATRSPSNVEDVRTSGGPSSRIERLGTDGDVVLVRDGRRWLSRPDEALVDAGPAAGRAYELADGWYVGIGPTLYRVGQADSEPAPPTDTGPGAENDAGADVATAEPPPPIEPVAEPVPATVEDVPDGANPPAPPLDAEAEPVPATVEDVPDGVNPPAPPLDAVAEPEPATVEDVPDGADPPAPPRADAPGAASSSASGGCSAGRGAAGSDATLWLCALSILTFSLLRRRLSCAPTLPPTLALPH